MLDHGDARALIERAWTKIGCDVRIPEDWSDFFDRHGQMQARYDERRRHQRYFYRQRAVLIDGEALTCVYTLDLSRSSIGFLNDRELLPKKRFRICLLDGKVLHVEIQRCRRIADRCYVCGAVFATSPAANKTGSSSVSMVVEGVEEAGVS